jgi:hypothetical protein
MRTNILQGHLNPWSVLHYHFTIFHTRSCLRRIMWSVSVRIDPKTYWSLYLLLHTTRRGGLDNVQEFAGKSPGPYGPVGRLAEPRSRIISGSFCLLERPWVTTDPRPQSSDVFVYVSQPTRTVCPVTQWASRYWGVNTAYFVTTMKTARFIILHITLCECETK